jgi:hypothetical protein
VESCLLGNNGAAQLRTEGESHTQVINSDLIGAPHAPALVREGGQVTVRERPQEPAVPPSTSTSAGDDTPDEK